MLKTNLLAAGAALGALVLAVPATALADAPAAAPSPGGLSFSDPNAPTVFADGSTLTAPLGQLVGDDVSVRGVVTGTRPGDAIAVQRADADAGWTTVASAVVAPDGSYSASWKADRAAKTSLRAVPAAPASGSTRAVAATGAGVQGRALTVYRRARVTWYGPGFFGRRTACGLRLRRATLGVAHKHLPCGTLVELYHDGATITVPVIDRGPFRPATSYDLTAATAKALGVTATTTIGAVRSTPAPVAAAAARAR